MKERELLEADKLLAEYREARHALLGTYRAGSRFYAKYEQEHDAVYKQETSAFCVYTTYVCAFISDETIGITFMEAWGSERYTRI